MRKRISIEHTPGLQLLVVGEAPRWEEVDKQEPYCDQVGKELYKMLDEAGWIGEFAMDYVSRYNVTNDYMPALFSKNTPKSLIPGDDLRICTEDLWKRIDELNPTVIVTLDEASLFMLTGNRGIRKWRGSQLRIQHPTNGRTYNLLPTYSPYTLQREWELRPIIVHDLKRAVAGITDPSTFEVPKYNFHVRQNFQDTMAILKGLKKECDEATSPVPLAIDLETRAGNIACFGVAWSTRDALCVPFMCVEHVEGFWPEFEEYELIDAIRSILLHPNAALVLQNGLYDFQYFAQRWLCIPRIHFDTMIAQHVMFVEMPKGLDFISSLYCKYHSYWKDEGKEWTKDVNEDQLWIYNCKDAVTTFECYQVLSKAIAANNLDEVLAFQHKKFHAVLRMMIKGVRIDLLHKSEMLTYVLERVEERQRAIENIIGQPLNIGSPKQMQEFFYGFLGVKPVKKKGRVTCNDDALTIIAKREPLAAPVIDMIKEARSFGVMMRNFIKMKLGEDSRARSSYNIAGTITYRWSSSKDAFGSGTNLQNIPAVDEDEDSIYPNIRRMFIPDPGQVIFDIDLDRADAQVVAWEAGDEELKLLFRSGEDLHLQNARDIFRDPTIKKNDRRRALAKLGVHATNYGVHPTSLARSLGITVREAEYFQKRWFTLHPGIKEWHHRVESQILQDRFVRNRFGYRRYFFGRIAGLLPEALAWVPQSTVGNVIDFGIMNLQDQKLAEVLLQVHDSAVGQCPERHFVNRLPLLRKAMLIEIPYEDPLTIPVGIKASCKSWGDCKDIAWNYKGQLYH